MFWPFIIKCLCAVLLAVPSFRTLSDLFQHLNEAWIGSQNLFPCSMFLPTDMFTTQMLSEPPQPCGVKTWIHLPPAPDQWLVWCAGDFLWLPPPPTYRSLTNWFRFTSSETETSWKETPTKASAMTLNGLEELNWTELKYIFNFPLLLLILTQQHFKQWLKASESQTSSDWLVRIWTSQSGSSWFETQHEFNITAVKGMQMQVNR